MNFNGCFAFIVAIVLGVKVVAVPIACIVCPTALTLFNGNYVARNRIFFVGDIVGDFFNGKCVKERALFFNGKCLKDFAFVGDNLFPFGCVFGF